MNSRDRARENASKLFIGYVKCGETDEYIVYEIKGITKKSARLRLKKVVKNLNSEESGSQFTIVDIFEPGDSRAEVFRTQHRIIEERQTTV